MLILLLTEGGVLGLSLGLPLGLTEVELEGDSLALGLCTDL